MLARADVQRTIELRFRFRVYTSMLQRTTVIGNIRQIIRDNVSAADNASGQFGSARLTSEAALKAVSIHNSSVTAD